MARRMREYPHHVSMMVIADGRQTSCLTYEIWDEKEDVFWQQRRGRPGSLCCAISSIHAIDFNRGSILLQLSPRLHSQCV